ncbi:MAG TPA: NADPH-dependent glutamate synthase [Phycisphaerae bacterium]|nr:NADPH-dependent glutamate synthase [Phycisphaerae bacterium]HNU44734.1 NADPH-dependent glutamate synthase [Phycisphaerae bacterium]
MDSGENEEEQDMKPSERMKIARQHMPEQEPLVRARRFTEVNQGYAPTTACLEAQRCLQCKDGKCIKGCPVGIDIPAFVAAVSENDLHKAADILFAANVLPGVTGRVCPQETQCEAECIRGKKETPVAVGYLERFVADWAREHRKDLFTPPPPTGKKVAIVGSGPAGLTCAGECAKRGHQVTIFEALHIPGGVLVYGIPEFRLPNFIVEAEVETLRHRGVDIQCDVVIGQTYTIPELMESEGFDAVFIANGAGLPIFQGIPGEHLKGVYSANEFLTRVNLMGAYRFRDGEADTPVMRASQVVVVGGGNTAMDSVRTAKRLGAEPAILVYRRSREEMPARIEEVKHAEEEGINIQILTNPVEVLGDEHGWVRAVRCQRMELGEPDDSGRRRPVAIKGSEFDIPCQVFIEAIGTRANPLLTQTTPGLKVNKWGYIEVDANCMTSIRGVFAGGDIVRGSATVILAMGDGKTAAGAIHRYLMNGK